MGGESFWLAGACNAVDFVLIPPDSHVRYTGQYRPNGVFVIIEYHRLVCRAYFTNIITGNGISVFRVVMLRRLLSPINGLVKWISAELNDKAKCQGWLMKGQAPMSWWDRGSTAPVLRESLAANPQGVSPNPLPLSRSICQTLAKCIGSTKISNPNSPV